MSIPNFYKPLAEAGFNIDEWKVCPVCNIRPKVWIFDNGSYAKCECNSGRGLAPAAGISIQDYVRQKHIQIDLSKWNHDDLRDNWNKIVDQRTPNEKI